MRAATAFCIVGFILLSIDLHGQSSDAASDTSEIYSKLKKLAEKKKFSRAIYRSLFNVRHPSVAVKSRAPNYEKYKGKIIRHIFITTLDPFGYDIADTSVHPKSVVQIGGNYLHQRTIGIAIRNQLLLRRGRPLDPLKVRESERILRQSAYVHNVKFTIVPVHGTDSVDVYIREQDVWSKTFAFGISDSKLHVGISEVNFLGFAHEVNADYYHFFDGSETTIKGNYIIPYLRNTFVTTTIQFNNNTENFDRGIRIRRPFYSPLAHWAGGIDYIEHKNTVDFFNPETHETSYAIKFNNSDYWVGRSFSLSKDSLESIRSTKFIFSARYNLIDFTLRPPFIADPAGRIQDTRFYMLGLGISSRTYYRDYYIYKYGIPEDVPSGKLIELLAGYESKESTERTYAGVLVSSGNHYEHFGYFSMSFGLGTFFNKSKPEQSVMRGNLAYFTDLTQIGKTKLRQFIKAQGTYGFHREAGEKLTINEENGIKGFNSSTLYGTNKLVFSFQTQAYLPFEIIGFHFAPILFLEFGFIGDSPDRFLNSRMYQGYGAGLLVKNELLVLSTFQVTLGYYPFIPGSGTSVFKYNPMMNYNFTFNDFGFDKPDIIPFR